MVAALGGFVLGLRYGSTIRVQKSWLMLVREVLVAGCGVVLLVALSSRILPPLSLMMQDVGAWMGWIIQRLRDNLLASPPPVRTGAFLAEALPRFARELWCAPQAGEQGARLLLTTSGVALTWLSSLAFGRALSGGKALLAWTTPLIVLIVIVTTFGGTLVIPLLCSCMLLFMFVIDGEFRQREQSWRRSFTDFSEEFRLDGLIWGGAALVIILTIAWLLPVWLRNPIATNLWGDVEAPSALEALDREAFDSRPVADTRQIGLSELPVITLGETLEQGDSEQVALRVQLDSPLPESAWPQYWRARILNIYTGRGWTTNARVYPQEASPVIADAFPDAMVQTIEDMRGESQLLVALPDVISVDQATNAEQLSDGTIAAMTVDVATTRYQVISRLQEFATRPSPDNPPNLSTFLSLPEDLPMRVEELARAVVVDADLSYEQALAIEMYLRSLPYSYEVRSLPARGDAVEQFLFDMQQGYCTYYASAMAVMSRSLNIPARVAVGYTTGEYDAAQRTYTVREVNAHAWPELYIDGRWMPFEPTPVIALPSRVAPVDDQLVREPVAPVAVAEPMPSVAWARWDVVLGVGIALIVGGMWYVRWCNQRGWHIRSNTVEYQVTNVQHQFERFGARAGIVWSDGVTIHEYAALLIARFAHMKDQIRIIVALITKARYSGHPLSTDEIRQLRDTWHHIQMIDRQQG
ncbi:MAG: Transglutaminase-like enzyme, putative cysteine protease [Chloroflexi bacterium AL-W]|nr:Transglutaminase-like enzyme, putative cysteine protease [Chloroflexi bacterium AL-N1]NOK71453.1 Transglutaminase-like enzyme, putative cysteine protease [Chloroflexi bacterium AL-N10]NOK77234.1 Transglutaminase-like enzyme, putative cysteine protease [Chloroflexi bacterium AL-N5]NOK86274.1 Transglutaminase-like enzyme, putative cysteine protease [Chloroflexi bacterium AL-W]NOK93244.1 Transglutaminase-like enzyme, putative cysteine protease [Chloroflexi bacterium AL-N15]